MGLQKINWIQTKNSQGNRVETIAKYILRKEMKYLMNNYQNHRKIFKLKKASTALLLIIYLQSLVVLFMNVTKRDFQTTR